MLQTLTKGGNIMPITTTKPKTLGEVHAYIESPRFNPYNFGEYLKVLGVSINDTLNGKTLLGMAVQKLNVSAVEKLLEHGADPKVLTRCINAKGDALGLPPIYWTAYSGPASDVSLDLTARIKIIDAILSRVSYEDVNIQEHPLMYQNSNAGMALQLLIHGASIRFAPENGHIVQAFKTLLQKIDTPESCLVIQQLHPDTVMRLERNDINLRTIQNKAIQAIKNGATPYKIGDKYTTFTQAALDALVEIFSPLPNKDETTALMRAALTSPDTKSEFSDETIEEFLHMSLHPNTKAYLESKGVDFEALSDAAVDKILQDGFDPLMEKSYVFSEHAIAAIEKAQAKLEADPTLLLYSHIHPNSFVAMGDEVTSTIKQATINELKDRTDPFCADKTLTGHAQELIKRIAEEVKADVSKWLAISELHTNTRDAIDAALKDIESSIDSLNAEILNKLKTGEDLGLSANDIDLITDLTPHAQKVISTLCTALELDQTLLGRVILGKNVNALISKIHVGGMSDLVSKVINILIDHEVRISDQYTDGLYDMLKADPAKMLYIRDENIEKIRVSLGQEKFEALKTAAISAVKEGAHSKISGHLETNFANGLFHEIIKGMKNAPSSYDRVGFFAEGIDALKGFAKDDPHSLADINCFAKERGIVVPTPTYVEALSSWLFGGSSASALAKPAATGEPVKTTTDKPAATDQVEPIVLLTDTNGTVVPLSGDHATPTDA